MSLLTMFSTLQDPTLIRRINSSASSRLAGMLGSVPQVFWVEHCFYIQADSELKVTELATLKWLLEADSDKSSIRESPEVSERNDITIVEAGPRMNFETAWSSNLVAALQRCGIRSITRVEKSTIYGIKGLLSQSQRKLFLDPIHDQMTQMEYPVPLITFETGRIPDLVRTIPVLQGGAELLRKYSRDNGFGWDEQDIQIVLDVFTKLRRNPTDVELFQIAQANSEHSRHGFFKGLLSVDGEDVSESLLHMVQQPFLVNPGNSVIAFCDDSSALRGGKVTSLTPVLQHDGSVMYAPKVRVMHPTYTAETHNFPTEHEPYEGAQTGAGGMFRDQMVPGCGGISLATTVMYCTANLHIPGYIQDWEQNSQKYRTLPGRPDALTKLIRGSDGAADYSNCYGQPILGGSVRTFEMMVAGQLRGWHKPILYAGGVGQMSAAHIRKKTPEKGMLIIQIGGPAYRIGMGGSTGSSREGTAETQELDFNSVQRGDPEMGRRIERVIRACVNLGAKNPIESAHDLGAGGDCNAVPEITAGKGGKIRLHNIPLGDPTLSTLEIWGNESQERNVLLIKASRFGDLQSICDRENCPLAVIGEITGDGILELHDEKLGTSPVKLPLNDILEHLPRKQFELQSREYELQPLTLPQGLTVRQAFSRVVRLPAVGSKWHVIVKGDRTVGGLTAQQQCCGPAHLPVSDFAMVAHSHFSLSGTAVALGEQPNLGLISPEAMVRMSVAEALMNMVGAVSGPISSVKCSANWMWAAKVPGEGARMVRAVQTLRDFVLQLRGPNPDGGKDSLSMTTEVLGPEGKERCIAPGELVIGAYAYVKDIRRKVTPDLKGAGNPILFIDLSCGKARLGGSALAQTYGQVGDECPDVEDAVLIKRIWRAIQAAARRGLIQSVHDRSDGGALVALAEMAFAGNLGFKVNFNSSHTPVECLFNQELGLFVEVDELQENRLIDMFVMRGIPFQNIGQVTKDPVIRVSVNSEEVLNAPMVDLRQEWQETSYQIDRLQANPECIDSEREQDKRVVTPNYRICFEPRIRLRAKVRRPTVAILRETGSNGEREMAAAFYAAGFDPFDVTMSDLISGKADIRRFRGFAAVGGFANKDVPVAGRAWAAQILLNTELKYRFDEFYKDERKFSLGVCNGCQFLTQMEWVPGPSAVKHDQQAPLFRQNRSLRFEARMCTVEIRPSMSIMLDGMAGSRLGIVVSHGEGRLEAGAEFLNYMVYRQLVPLRYIDPEQNFTEAYPHNPNGSPRGIAGICSPDGRHLAMMPHPERLFLLWQWPWKPKWWDRYPVSPWLKMFQNARDWCDSTDDR